MSGMTDIRERLCECLRDPAAPIAPLSADVVAHARLERVHLILANRTGDAALRDDLRAAAVIEAARERELQTVLAQLAHAGVRTILLKGVSLARTHYPRPELRPRTDTDLMISPAHRDLAARALVAC